MYGQNIQHSEPIILLLLVCIVALATLAKRFETPYPIVLVVAGLFLSLIPRVPHIELNPNVVFLLFLPPLLFAAAYQTSWRDFRYNISSISLLALGLVSFTVYGVAIATHWIFPGFTWGEGLVLGAVVCTTDAIAPTSIALAKVVALIVAKIDDAPIEITISLLTPYFAYLAAESVHSSGVLATVACGMYLGHQSSMYFSTRARLQGAAVWETLSFVLNGIVFILIGLQLPDILSRIRTLSLGRLIFIGLLVSAVVIVLRLLWIYPGAWAATWIRTHMQHQSDPLPG